MGEDLIDPIKLVEVLCNWRSVENLRNIKLETRWPRDEVGGPVCEKPTSILIRFPERDDIDIIELRDWLIAKAGKKFKMFHRFRYETYQYRVERAYLGVNFRFQESEDAVLFKMFWG